MLRTICVSRGEPPQTDPEECIDCDACVEACPVDACFAEDQLPDEWQKFTQINADYFANAK